MVWGDDELVRSLEDSMAEMWRRLAKKNALREKEREERRARKQEREAARARHTPVSAYCGDFSPERGYIQSVDHGGMYKVSPDAGDTSSLYDEVLNYEEEQAYWDYVRSIKQRNYFKRKKKKRRS